MKTASLIRTQDVKNFIKNELRKKLSRELLYEKFAIVSEADLQAATYFHLKKYLNKDNRYKIYNKIYLKQFRKKSGNYPDIVILRFEAVPRIALEFKEHKGLIEKDVKKDVEKLSKFPRMQHGYLIYLTRQTGENSDKLTGRAENMVKQYLGKVTPLVINSYDYIPRSEWKKWKKRWDKYSKLRIRK